MYLGLKCCELTTIREIAERYQFSENHQMKVVHRLGMDSSVDTVSDRQGGLLMVRTPNKIYIGDAVRR